MKHVAAKSQVWNKNFEGIDGVDVCMLWPKPNGGATLMAKVAKGATIPAHSHKEYEETYVVSGKIDAGNGVIAGAGDYLLMESSDQHQLTALEDTTFFVSVETGFEWLKK
jgi:quercetin dioxygenase-like cupin family protein